MRLDEAIKDGFNYGSLLGEDMNEKISVIVPVYKVEDYLDKCVQSLVNQTYKNLEIILVDDGSPDACPQMCDKWAKADSRIKVIHKPNGGLSDARNAAMRIATGEYISFIDSDDCVADIFFEKLTEAMLRENSDIVECEVLKFCEGEAPFCAACEFSAKTYETEEALSLLISEKAFRQHVWNKLYKRESALSVMFEKGKLNEDEFWTYQVFGKAERVTKIDLPMYFYLQRSGSIMGTAYSLRRLDALEAKVLRQKYIEDKFPLLSSVAKTELFGSCIFACQSAMRYMSSDEKKKAKCVIKSYAKACKPKKEDLKLLDGKTRMWFFLANVSFELCCKIRNMLGVGF